MTGKYVHKFSQRGSCRLVAQPQSVSGHQQWDSARPEAPASDAGSEQANHVARE